MNNSFYIDAQIGITLFGKLIKPDLYLMKRNSNYVKIIIEIKKVTSRGTSNNKSSYCFSPDGVTHSPIFTAALI